MCYVLRVYGSRFHNIVRVFLLLSPTICASSVHKEHVRQYKILIPAFNVTSHGTITRDSWPHAAGVLQKIDLPTTVLITP